MVLCRQSVSGIDHEDDRIRLGHSLPSLLGHLLEDAGRAVRFEATGIDGDELMRAHAALTIVTVAGQACEVGHDGIAALGQAIEQRRLADVGSSDQRNDRFHEISVKKIS